MTADHLSGLPNLVQGATHHFVGYGVGEKDKQIRAADLLVQIGAHLSEYLCLAVIIFTDFFILAYHSVMAADDNNAHGNSFLIKKIVLKNKAGKNKTGKNKTEKGRLKKEYLEKNTNHS